MPVRIQTGPADQEARGTQYEGRERGGGDKKEGPKRPGAGTGDSGARRKQQKAHGGKAGLERRMEAQQ